ncbi:SHOCT-like domain-containing protein [Catenuloplanes atrovinosus]|uniref:YvlB/LiaX N-terminal domain-containing protein n=1 Tax=Catenuloplanes atrovinosus TaxID=137266 RepID=A0AAE3YMC7_9ACTN|nr:hypothetical protein [Catenuloplanes atrovinosus]MDR7276428.1 hypothetical protein [Catenuloplanes atrovinosus]
MTEQRKDILDMLAEGKITAAEADQLIAALERDRPPSPPGPDGPPTGRPKYLRLMVETVENGEEGRINIRVPLQLLRAGVRLAALIPPVALEHANAQLHRSGVPIDLAQLKPEQLEALVEHLDDVIVDVAQPDASVRVFCE